MAAETSASEAVASDPAAPQPPREETRIHVGNLTFNADEEYLQNVFSEYGEIAAVKVIRERGRSKGYGFIDFVNSQSAEDAIKARDRTQLDGRTITVAHARPRDAPPEPKANVHVGKLPPQCDDRSLREFFCDKLSQPDTLEEARVVTSRSQNNESAGYGFVRFRTTQDAARAIEELSGAEFEGVQIEVAYARRTGERQPLRSIGRRGDRPMNGAGSGGGNRNGGNNRRSGNDQNDGAGGNYYNNGAAAGSGGNDYNGPRSSPPRRGGFNGGGSGGRRTGGSGGNSYRERDGSAPLEEGSEQFIGRRVFVGGLSEETDEQCLELNFSAYGQLENCEIVRDKRTNRSRSYAFVTYRTEQQAHDAVEGMNGIEIDDKEIQVELARSRGKRIVSAPYSSSPSGGAGGRGPRNDQNNGGYSNYNGGGGSNNSYNGGGRRYTGGGGGNYPRSNNARPRYGGSGSGGNNNPPQRSPPQQQQQAPRSAAPVAAAAGAGGGGNGSAPQS